MYFEPTTEVSFSKQLLPNSCVMDEQTLNTTSCEDVQFLLRNLRVVDDKIIYGLNLATPTHSFHDKVNPAEQCELLFNQMAQNYKQRGALLDRCLDHATQQITQLRTVDPSTDPSLTRKVKAERAKVRELRNELGIEEILRERGRKVFTERCFPYYRGYEGW